MLFVACGLLLPGCWNHSPRRLPQISAQNDLSDDFDELVRFADAEAQEDASIDKLTVAVAAYEKAIVILSSTPESLTLGDLQWHLARACFLASEVAKESSEKMIWIVKGEDAAEIAMREHPNKVEGVYYMALLKGRRAQYSGVGFSAMILAGKVEKLGKRAQELDEKFEEGGPLRLLAMLYANAPPWPTSIGDIDLAIEYADRAVKVSNYPMNYLIRAEVLIEDGELSDAKKELKRVLAAPKTGKWAREGERWRPYAEKLLRKINSK